jgi:hypothetical protein
MPGTAKTPEKTYSPDWGGARDGGGRKKLSDSGRIQIQISLQQSEIEMIKELAEKAGLNRSRFIVECVKAWKETH